MTEAIKALEYAAKQARDLSEKYRNALPTVADETQPATISREFDTIATRVDGVLSALKKEVPVA